jgi:pSer/pThr/pTyr-binding forkhead associated (FHA) protein
MSTVEHSPATDAHSLKLVIEDDEGAKVTYPLLHPELTIGRDEDNDICLKQRTVSRKHAQLSVQPDGVSLLVRDLESYMGVKLNGKKISQQCAFRVGDFIELGDYVLSLQSPENAPPVEEPKVSNDPLPPEAHAKLVAVSSNLAGQAYPLDRRELIIGREPAENDVVIQHRSVSRNHAKIIWRDHHFTVIDLRSSNGILVNGSPFRAANLVTGDVITLGHVKLRFVAPGDPYVFSPADIEAVEVEGGFRYQRELLFLVVALVAFAVSRLLFAPTPPPQDPSSTTPTLEDPSSEESPQGGEATIEVSPSEARSPLPMPQDDDLVEQEAGAVEGGAQETDGGEASEESEDSDEERDSDEEDGDEDSEDSDESEASPTPSKERTQHTTTKTRSSKINKTRTATKSAKTKSTKTKSAKTKSIKKAQKKHSKTKQQAQKGKEPEAL